jgi:hypothetical protein
MSQNISLVVLVVSVCVQLLLAVPALPIVDPTPVPPGELLGMVKVTSRNGNDCTGMVIGSKTVLTAAHCVRTVDLVGGNDCFSRTDVTFRDDPHTPGFLQPKLSGMVTVHPDYNPSWIETQIEHDLAIITLDGVRPAHAKPLIVSDGYLAEGSTVMIVGQGLTGSDCSGPLGTFNFALTTVDNYEDGHDIMSLDDEVFCKGDSGGAVLDAAGSRLHGVVSMRNTATGTNKAVTTGSEFDWIKSHTCCDSKNSSDILWRSTDGWVAYWSAGWPTESIWTGILDHTWQIQGVGKFD